MKALPRFLLPLSLLLAACDSEPQAPANLPPEAAAEYRELCKRMETYTEEHEQRLGKGSPTIRRAPEDIARERRILEEMRELLLAYGKSGDASLCAPTMGQTMLHFAVQFRKEALVKALLQQGADPNATCDLSTLNIGVQKMDAPLVWAVVPDLEEVELRDTPFRETAIRLIDSLAAAGAKLNGAAGGHALLMCSIVSREGAEDVYLHLLSLGATPHKGYLGRNDSLAYIRQAVDCVIRNRWTRALGKLLEMGHIPADFRDSNEKTLLFSAVEKQLFQLRSGESYEDTESPEVLAAVLQEECAERLTLIRTLLEHGANPNAPQGGGWTVMNYATAISPEEMLPGSTHPDKTAAVAAWRELLTLLIHHGGDVNVTIPAYGDKPARRVSDCLPPLP